MSKWKGPFKELHEASLGAGAQDMLEAVKAELTKTGLSEEKARALLAVLDERASTVTQRHPYSYGMLHNL